MKIVKVFTLLCIVSSSVALYRSPCDSKVFAARHAEDLSNISDSCFCPKPNDGNQVADLLNKKKSDLQRVVVFYYKDKTNNEVYMYTPSSDKQLVIPELQYDAQDDLEKIDSQVPLELFDTNNVLLQNYQKPNHNRHRHHHNTKNKLTYLPNADYYPPHVWFYQQGWNNQLRPDGFQSNDELENTNELYQYVPYSQQKKWAMKNKNKKSLNKQVFENNADNAQAPNANAYDFDKWYSKNVIQFSELYSGDTKYITFNDLREQLLRIFNEHGYSIINNQVLDPQGEEVDSSNFKLVRVKIKQENDEKDLSSEVEGVMFIKVAPMTILGVVPVTNNIEETNETEYNEIPDEHDYEKIINADAKMYAKSTGNATETDEAGSTAKPKTLNALLNNLVSMVNGLVPFRRESDVDPRFRIIGGSAATGSGAPISSKGRSGTPH